jgi:hypothetical protein
MCLPPPRVACHTLMPSGGGTPHATAAPARCAMPPTKSPRLRPLPTPHTPHTQTVRLRCVPGILTPGY